MYIRLHNVMLIRMERSGLMVVVELRWHYDCAWPVCFVADIKTHANSNMLIEIIHQ